MNKNTMLTITKHFNEKLDADGNRLEDEVVARYFGTKNRTMAAMYMFADKLRVNVNKCVQSSANAGFEEYVLNGGECLFENYKFECKFELIDIEIL